MEFALFTEIPVPRPWTPDSERRAVNEAVEQAVYAEEMGFDSFWTVEHHFLDEYSHCTAPEVLYGAISQRTKRIRIGHGVRLLPYPYNHPIRVAEQAAFVDILSNGRLEFGTGRSISRNELEGFGIPPHTARGRWEESLRLITALWKTPLDQKFSWESEHFKIPPRFVIPRPVQQPHPPIWLATSGVESHELAGKLGLGLLSFTVMIDPEELARRIGIYRNALKDAEPIGAFVNGRAACFSLVYCGSDNQRARTIAGDSMVWYVQSSIDLLTATLNWGMELGGDKALGAYDHIKALFGLNREEINFDYLDQRQMVINGDPDKCVRNIKSFQEAGVDLMLCMMQGHGVSHSDVMESIRLFGQHVIPKFH